MNPNISKLRTISVKIMDSNQKFDPSSAVNAIAQKALNHLADQFPVCIASDEFHFFPQMGIPDSEATGWDDFSPDAVDDIVGKLADWEQALSPFQKAVDNDTQMDAVMLSRVFRTLREQLTEIRFHEQQPTFYLTIVSIGLADALEAGEPVWAKRISALPGYIDGLKRCLTQVPALFRDLGIEMAQKLSDWLKTLMPIRSGIPPVLDSLHRLKHLLAQMAPADPVLLAPEVYETVARDHIGCRMTVEEIIHELDQEIAETADLLTKGALRILPNSPWQQAIKKIPRPDPDSNDPTLFYQSIIADLSNHCRSIQLVTENLLATCPVEVTPVPAHLTPIRSAAAYSMSPGHPPKGGTFYIISGRLFQQIPRDVRLLTAHETFPGHHLLDTARWNHTRPVRRHIEFPLFYEGWASFSEELLFDTGFFSGTIDGILLAKRRFWRAVRGRIDVDLHTGRRNVQAAATFLTETGLKKDQALSMVKRYTLKPGYQLSYTIGRRGFRSLYDRFRDTGGEPAEFARRVFAQGEIGLDQLERRLFN